MIDGATAINVSGSTKTLTHYVPSTNNNLNFLELFNPFILCNSIHSILQKVGY